MALIPQLHNGLLGPDYELAGDDMEVLRRQQEAAQVPVPVAPGLQSSGAMEMLEQLQAAQAAQAAPQSEAPGGVGGFLGRLFGGGHDPNLSEADNRRARSQALIQAGAAIMASEGSGFQALGAGIARGGQVGTGLRAQSATQRKAQVRGDLTGMLSGMAMQAAQSRDHDALNALSAYASGIDKDLAAGIDRIADNVRDGKQIDFQDTPTGGIVAVNALGERVAGLDMAPGMTPVEEANIKLAKEKFDWDVMTDARDFDYKVAQDELETTRAYLKDVADARKEGAKTYADALDTSFVQGRSFRNSANFGRAIASVNADNPVSTNQAYVSIVKLLEDTSAAMQGEVDYARSGAGWAAILNRMKEKLAGDVPITSTDILDLKEQAYLLLSGTEDVRDGMIEARRLGLQDAGLDETRLRHALGPAQYGDYSFMEDLKRDLEAADRLGEAPGPPLSGAEADSAIVAGLTRGM